MPRFRPPRWVVPACLAAGMAVGLSGTSGGQFLDAGETKPAPEFRSVAR